MNSKALIASRVLLQRRRLRAERLHRHSGRLQTMADRAAQLGTLGTERSEGHRQPHHAAESAERRASRAQRHRRLARRRGAAAGSGRRRPNQVFRRTTNSIGPNTTTDTYQVSYHGLSLGHTDAFCHFFIDGQMYNGYSVKENITPETGCKQGSIMGRRDGIVTRGVLYDMPQMKGVEWIEPGTPITRADLEAWEKRSGVRVGPGDVIVLYVGRWKRRAAKGPWSGQVAGYYADTIPFFKERDISFAAHDMNIDWSPRPGWGAEQGIPGNPVHQALLVWLGAGIVENLDLENLAATARKLKRYEFMLTFAPIPVEGGSGSPVNPLAIFFSRWPVAGSY